MLGRSILPPTSKSMLRWVSGAPTRRVATATAESPAASHCAPVPATPTSVNPTCSVFDGDASMRTVTWFEPPTVVPAALVDTKTGSTVTEPVPVPAAVVGGVGLAVALGVDRCDPPWQAAASRVAPTSIVNARRPDR